MSATISAPVRQTTSIAVPWYIWCAVAAVTCAMTGVHWDISWHRSIGRDTFLDPGAHRYLPLRRTGGHLLRLSDSAHHAAPRLAAAGRVGHAVGIPRTAGRVPGRLGRHRHAHLRALRRLVAQRLWARREDPQPAAHGAGRRHVRRARRRADADPRPHESRRGRRAHPLACAVSLCGRYDSGVLHGAADGDCLSQLRCTPCTSTI